MHALPYPPVTTSLYNHNNFVSVADDEVPLMQLRAVRVNEKKIKEAADKTKLIEKVSVCFWRSFVLLISNLGCF